MHKNITVLRSVLSAAQRLAKLCHSVNDCKPLDLAEAKIENCLAAEDNAGVKFWRSVWIHLMLVNYAPGQIQIIEDE
jgi:hypothetical protein